MFLFSAAKVMQINEIGQPKRENNFHLLAKMRNIYKISLSHPAIWRVESAYVTCDSEEFRFLAYHLAEQKIGKATCA